MKMVKKLAVTLGLAAGCMLLASNASAQTSPVGFAASGSSAMWQGFGIAARVDSSVGTSQQGNCFPNAGGPPPVGDNFHIWTGKNTSGGSDKRAIIHDGRVDSSANTVPDVKGNVWIVWDDTAHPNKNICVYVNVDSGVGVRALFAFPQAVIQLPALDGTGTAAGDNLISSVLLNGNADEVLPVDIFNSVNGTTVNVAMTDVRPEDAYFAHLRVFFNACQSGTCLGYPSKSGLGQIQGPVGGISAFASAFSSGTLAAATFNLTGGGSNSDPISGQPIPAPLFRFSTAEVGAAPVMVVVNKTQAGVGHLGDSLLTGVNTFTLAASLDGTLTHTADIFTNYAAGALANIPLNVWVREPISGTYNTMEFDVVRSRRYASTQENGNIPAANCFGGRPLNPPHNSAAYNANLCAAAITNPMNIAGANGGGLRKRAIGTGDMVNALSATADSLGYAFWSFGNFASSGTVNPANLKYLTVDGVDPLAASYAGGALPQCPSPITPPNFCTGVFAPKGSEFPHVADGTYPIWAQLQMVTLVPPYPQAPLAAPLLAGSQNAVVNKVPDYIPSSALNVFRSHWTQSYAGISPRNGHCASGAGGALTGSQMGGAVFPIQADFDSCADNGTELTELKQ